MQQLLPPCEIWKGGGWGASVRRPLLWLTIGFASGIVLGDWMGVTAVLGAAVLFAVSLSCRRELLTVCLLGCCLGAACLLVRTPVWPGEYGRVETQVRVQSVESRSQVTWLTVQVEQLGGQPIPFWNPLRARLAVQGGEYAPGDVLTGVINFEEPEQPLNPGQFDYAAYLRRQGILADAFINDPGSLQQEAAPQAGPAWLPRWLGQRAARVGGDAGELLGKLLLGSSAQGDWVEAWRTTGLAHVLSVSGLHVGLLLLLMRQLIVRLRFPARWHPAVLAAWLLIYGLIIGPRPAVWRAIIMAWVGLLAVATGRLRDWMTTLAAAALLILLYNPAYLFDVGFQLSFAATWGILALAPVLEQRLPGLPFRLERAIAVSLAAQAATLPLCVYYFYLLSPLALVFNLIVVPVLPLVLGLGLAYLVVPVLGDLLLPLLRLVLRLILLAVDWFATWPGASLSLGAVPWLLVALYLALLGSLPLERWRSWRKLLAPVCALCLVLLLTWQPLARWARNEYQFTVFGVGQGMASALHLPGGSAVLFDVGGGHTAVGENILVPALRYYGTRRIQAIYLSHLHDDHTLGLAAVLAAFPVDRIYIAAQSLQSPAYTELAAIADEHRVPLLTTNRGDLQRYGAARVTVLHPAHGPARVDENGDSLVLQLSWPEFSLLLPGDIGIAEEAELLPYLAGAPDLLVAGHHGSAGSNSQELLQALRPDYVIIPTGPNLYGHPSPAAISRLEQYSRVIWRTDQQGAVLVRIRPRQVLVRAWLDD